MKGKDGKRRDNKGRVLPANISQKSDGRYIWRKRINGRQYVITDNDLLELKKKITQKEADIQKGICGELEKSTLNQWFYEWMDVYKNNIKPVTKQNYLNYWKWYVEESNVGKMQLGKLKRMHIVQLYRYLLEEKQLAVGTVKYIHSLITNCIEDAVEDKLLIDNPSKGALSKVEKRETKKREALTLKQQEEFVNFIAESETYKIHLPLFSFLLGTGCRLGEALGMTWKDIDMKKEIVSVNHTLSYKALNGKHDFFITIPKTKNSVRDIPIIKDLKVQLNNQRKRQFMMNIPRDYEVDGYTDFVFTTMNGKPYTQEAVNSFIKRIVKAHNEQEEKIAQEEHREPELLPYFSAHTLRHTFCTRFCEVESNVKVIQQIMGHSRIDTTMNVYTHVTQEAKKETMDNLNGKIKIS